MNQFDRQDPHLLARAARAPRRPLVLLLATAMLAGCAAGPDYRAPPAVDVGNGWVDPPPATTPAPDLAQWWRNLGDPQLDRLIDAALRHNLDLRQATARIDEARALRDRAAGGRQPVVAGSGNVNRRQQSRHGPLPVGALPGLDATQTIHDVGFDAAWEIDLAGGQRRALEAADARLAAMAADASGVRMRVAAEVARTWYEASGAAAELRSQRALVQLRAQTLALTRERLANGDAARADLDTATAQWAAADALLPAIEARQRATVLGLAVLLGAPPERELALLDAPPAAPRLLPLPVGERADILRRRPDVAAAERRLAASSADVGVATAELFPRLSIAVGGGFQALDASQWLDRSSSRFSLLPLISWRVFDGGRVRAEIRAREAAQRQAAAVYEQVVLAALGEAERALAEYRASLDTLARQQHALAAARRSCDHARARHTAGDIALFEVLVAERTLQEAQLASTQAQTAATTRLVALYKALGGGWGADAASVQAPSPGHALAATPPPHTAAY